MPTDACDSEKSCHVRAGPWQQRWEGVLVDPAALAGETPVDEAADSLPRVYDREHRAGTSSELHPKTQTAVPALDIELRGPDITCRKHPNGNAHA